MDGVRVVLLRYAFLEEAFCLGPNFSKLMFMKTKTLRQVEYWGGVITD